MKVTAEYILGYYCYEDNTIRAIEENGVRTIYYEDQQIKEISNNSEENVISVNDAYGNVYQLNKGDCIVFRPNGNLMNMKKGENYYNFYKSKDQSYYIISNKADNIKKVYHNDAILYETDQDNRLIIETTLDGITRIKLEDGTIIDDEPAEELER